MSRYRPTRIGELLQAEIAQLLLRQLKDPRLSMATILLNDAPSFLIRVEGRAMMGMPPLDREAP